MTRRIPAPKPSDLARFWSKVSNHDTNGCQNWTGPRDRHGYGSFSMRSLNWKAHRVSWTIANGQIGDGLELDHLCRNPSCVRPDHLEPVTHAENMRRGRGGEYNGAKTHCPQGHEYTLANTKLY